MQSRVLLDQDNKTRDIRYFKMAFSSACSARDKLTKSVVLFGEELIVQLGKEHKDNGKISEETLNKLHFIYGPSLYQALDSIDRNEIAFLSTPAGKHVYTVNTSRGPNQYICIQSLNYCTCPFFTYRVLVRGDALICKHLLSVKLAMALETLPHQPKLVSVSELMVISNSNK